MSSFLFGGWSRRVQGKLSVGVFAALLLVLVARAPGPNEATFYVAPDGNDAWSGTLPAPNAAHSDGPFATFEHARTQVQLLNKT